MRDMVGAAYAASTSQYALGRARSEQILQAIKARIRMRDVCNCYGIEIGRGSFAVCPFHNEKTPSLKVYEWDFHCFGCGAHGDVIAFVRQLFALSFQETLRKINADFSLGCYDECSFDELRCSHYQHLALQSKAERERAEKQRVDNEYWAAFDEWKRLDDNRHLYRPQPGGALHPLFVESLQWLDYQKHILDCLDEQRRRYD